MNVLSRNLPIIFHLLAHHLGFRTSVHSINHVNFLGPPLAAMSLGHPTSLPTHCIHRASHAFCGLCTFREIPPRTAPPVLALTVSLKPRCICASHPFFRSSGLTLSGHEPPKTLLILLNMGLYTSKVPITRWQISLLGGI